MSTKAEVTKADEVNGFIPEPPPYNQQVHGITPVQLTDDGPRVDLHIDNSTGAQQTVHINGPNVGHVVVYRHISNSPGAQQTVVVNGRPMGPDPVMYTCPSCNQQIMTRVELKTTMKTHLFAALLCALACIPCMCLPYCMKSCKDVHHYCPHCDVSIGSNMIIIYKN